ncbi:MFS transporter, putative [Talaromyces islandicus]|uniref:MFS transporter, putative n=1 Tax=Talaromyces islandicus TaxID=28573 RepID=A0A0U1M0X7_TALIS|nr:MFS transporter, putative [Talaromyces islandicus]
MTSHGDEITECTPLLSDAPPSNQQRDWKKQVLPQWTWKKWRVILVVAVTLLFISFGDSLGTAPQVSLFEEVACQNYKKSLGLVGVNGSATLDGDICKSEPVQSEVAFVIGWKNTLDIIPSVALSLPYGVVADKIGRRPVVIISLMAIGLSEILPRLVCWFHWPLRLVWLTGLVRAPGGGDIVATTVLLVIVSDIFEADERATALFRLNSLGIAAQIIATPISASTMNIDPWIPYFLGLVLTIASATISFFLPETLGEAKAKRQMTEETEDEAIPESLQPSATAKDSVFNTIITQAQQFISSTRHMWRNSRVLVLLAVAFAGSMEKSSLFLLIQYASAKFSWSISEASYLISVRGCMTLAAYLFLVPFLSTYLTRSLHYSAVEKDLYISRASAVFGVVGYFLLFTAPTPALLIFGTLLKSLSLPFLIAVMSVATAFVSPEHVATLYSAMSVTQSLGTIVAGPTFAKLYAVGMRLGLGWSGLPFAVGSLIFIVVLIPVMYIRPARLGPSN